MRSGSSAAASRRSGAPGAPPPAGAPGCPAAPPAGFPPPAPRAHRPGSRGGRRRLVLAHAPKPTLPVVEIRHELPPTDRQCAACGGELMEMIGQADTSERITTVKLTYQVEHHMRQKYRCACTAAVVTAGSNSGDARQSPCARVWGRRGGREVRRPPAARAPSAHDGPRRPDRRVADIESSRRLWSMPTKRTGRSWD